MAAGERFAVMVTLSCRDAGMTLAIARGSTPSARNLFSQV